MDLRVPENTRVESRAHQLSRWNVLSECMISFMYEPIRRFHQQTEFRPHLDKLFGTTEWERCLDMEESDAKKQFLHRLFDKGHLRRKTLQPLERAGRITVSRPGGARGFKSGKGIKVRFL